MREIAVRLDARLDRVRRAARFRVLGRVTQLVGPLIEATAADVAIGDLCRVQADAALPVDAEVVGFRERGILLMPLGEVEGIHPGALVEHLRTRVDAPVGDALIGRVLDGLGRPIDAGGPLLTRERRPAHAAPPPALSRRPITEPLVTGVRVLDGLLTLGRGQRIGIFAGSGVGKSTLLGMIARYSAAEVNVIALLGERGREVGEFLKRDLGETGLRRSVVVVATSDQPAAVRAKGAQIATAIAEDFRDRGKDVLLMVDSITRVAMAWREIGLAAGEPPTSKGYPPSVFAHLPRLLERSGMSARGAISGIYTVLVEGDDFNEPVADTARSILDGHIVLTRRLATAGQLPAVDCMESVSRVRDQVIDPAHRSALETLLRLEGVYRAHEDLIAIGAYQKGTRPEVDAAIALRPDMLALLRQRPDDFSRPMDTRARLLALAARARQEGAT
jgi:FliI/YscN family ATPase